MKAISDIANSKEFRKEAHFRGTPDRTCFNCAYHWVDEGASRPGPYGERTYDLHVCRWDKDRPRTAFRVTQFNVCDMWKRKRDPWP